MKSPIIGVGLGNSPFEMQKVLSVSGDLIRGVAIHNPLIVIWSETGLIGIILYLSTLFSAIFVYVIKQKKYIKLNICWAHNYYALVLSLLCAYLPSWLKGGGAESDFTYFFIISLLLVPSSFNFSIFTYTYIVYFFDFQNGADRKTEKYRI